MKVKGGNYIKKEKGEKCGFQHCPQKDLFEKKPYLKQITKKIISLYIGITNLFIMGNFSLEG